MRRHWQHTSFCMGQCVSSCGSKRTLDSVPTTPDTENYPGLYPTLSSTTTRSVSSGGKSSNFTSSKEHHCEQQILNQQVVLAAVATEHLTKSPAAKFVTAFSQRKLSSHRINPGGESPLHISGPSSPSILPLKITTLLSPAPVKLNQDGDMKGTPLKSYFRDTISSAKKSSKTGKTVTFSEAVPSPNTSSTRKKSFFSFTKSAQKKDNQSSTVVPPEQVSLSQSPKIHKGFLRRKSSSQSPTTPVSLISKPVKEKQICRVTLSLKHSTSKQGVGDVNVASSSANIKVINDDGFNKQNPSNSPPNERKTMGNVSSDPSSGSTVGLVKHFKPVVKSSSVSIIKTFSNKGDINENVASRHHTLPTAAAVSNSVENSGVINQDDKPPGTKSSQPALRDLNSIREENRLLRQKFFLQDSAKSANLSSATQQPAEASAAANTNSNKMNRNIPPPPGVKSAIPLPKSFAKPVNTISTIPKLYSVVATSDEEHIAQKPSTSGNTNTKSRLKFNPAESQQQPTNLNSGKWVPAAEFFRPPATPLDSVRPQTSPATSSRINRRSSEPPPRWVAGNKPARDGKLQETHLERRGTVGFQPRKLPMAHVTTSIPKVAKTVTTTTIAEKSSTTATTATKSTSRIGVRKPEETKPFYTLGLYQNRPKPAESSIKSFGIHHQSGFHDVSTGIVRQRAQQFQSKSPETSKLSVAKEEQKNLSLIQESPSPKKPGVLRSATYTIRKHGGASATDGQGDPKGVVKAKSDVDPRYLTWTRKGSAKGISTATSGGLAENISGGVSKDKILPSAMVQSIESESSFQSHVGYPLQHNASATSTSSMGTNEDGVGDHAVISDSEYLIDDEISDQPDLTLTFKDSSLKLSSSSSGESLLSCDIMLDHLDHNQDRILGDLTSDSAISDISSHKPISQSSSDQILKPCDLNVKASALDHLANTSMLRSSPIESPSPASIRTVRNPKSPRRIPKASTIPQNNMTTSSSKPVRQASGDSFNSPRSGNSNCKSSGNNAGFTATSKQRSALDARLAAGKPAHVRSILTSPSSPSSAVNPQRTLTSSRRDNVVDLTIENVNKFHKQCMLAEAAPEDSPTGVTEPGLPVSMVKELLVEFQGMKEELERLRIQLESQEKRESEKDELIQRLTADIDWLRSTIDKKSMQGDHINGSVKPLRNNESVVPTSEKERYLNSLNYENAAVQTENNNIFNRSVTYPEEEDKYGELVSFRIGRSSSLKKKL